MSNDTNPIQREIPRRTFIIGVLASVFGFSLLGWWRLRSRRSDPFDSVGDVLRQELSYLDLAPEGVERFSIDVQDAMSQVQISPTGELIEPAVPVIDGIAFQIESGSIRFYEDTVVRKFLFSSDFFLEDANESRTINYVGWFDEFGPCSNPFAQLD